MLFLQSIENTSWKVLAYGIYARVVDVSEIERVRYKNTFRAYVFFFYFNSLNSRFLGSESFRQDIGQLHSSRADETFANRWIIYQRQFRYCSGYGARRVQTIYQISTWKIFF